MGIIGAGKSTYAKKLQEKVGGEIIASDEIRREFVEEGKIPLEYDSKYNSLVFDEMHRRIEKCAKEGKNIIADSTNVLKFSRTPIIKIAEKYGYKVSGQLFLIDDKESEKRVQERQEKNGKTSHFIADIPLAIKTYKERLFSNFPTLEEGFHEIEVFENDSLKERQVKPLIASSNAGKIEIYSQILKELNMPYCSLRDLNVDIEVEENGETELENALIKAKAYHEATGLPVISNDSGLIIEKFAPENQPGVFVRRYGGRELSDEETIEIFSKMLKEVGGESDAYFNVALAICDKKGNYHTNLFKSFRYMIEKPSKTIQKGLPLRSLDFNKELGKYMSEMTIDEANAAEGECIKAQQNFIKEVLQLNKKVYPR